jgi:hypothetical protein
MSENILIAKSRKTGKWVLLVDPGETYDAHLRAYQKIASAIPVNDEFSRVLLGRVQNTSTALSLITSEEKKVRDTSLEETREVAANAGKDAEERQAKLTALEALKRAEVHDTVIDDKNAMINKLRKATGQEVFTETKTEQSETALREQLSKVKTAPKISKEEQETQELADANKTKEQLLQEKNDLTASSKKQSAELLTKNK